MTSLSPDTHRRFLYRDSETLKEDIRGLELPIPWDEDISPLLEPVGVGPHALPNRLAVHPMEGFDGDDEVFLRMIAGQLALAMGTAYQSRSQTELARAREIQQSLLPASLPRIGGVEVAARWMFTIRSLSDITTSTTASTKVSGRSQLAMAKFHIETERAGASSVV